MNTNPSIDDMLEAVILGIDDDLLPELANPKAQATAVMMQSILQGVRQLLPEFERRMIEEHNAMLGVHAQVAAAIGDSGGEAAQRVRDRATQAGEYDELPAPVDRAEVSTAHRELSASLAAMLPDLDELQRGGITEADDALQVLRGHLGPRFVRDVASFSVGEGFVGRG